MSQWILSVPEQKLEREMRLRRAFVDARIRQASAAELKDLLEFMHGPAAPLYGCAGCGLVARGESTPRGWKEYQTDENDRDLMRQLLPRYIEAFRRKQPYRELLPRGARVLEVGSHVGGFLHTAAEWDWDIQAIDVGRDTSEFGREQGFRVHRTVLEEAAFLDGTFAAIFFWNCFEQIPDPRRAVRAAHRLLADRGLLIVRVPNALSYLELSERYALAYNNLLGFPYLYGYTENTLNRIMTDCGFEPVLGFNSELVTMPFADPTERVRREQRRVSRRMARWSRAASRRWHTLAGPWIEIVYRKSNRPLRHAGERQPDFLARAA